VGFLFDRRGRILIQKEANPDDQMLELIDLGVLDVVAGEDLIEVLVEPSKLYEVKTQLDSKYKVVEAELAYLPKNPIEIEEESKEKVVNFLNSLDDMDDVLKVYSNVKL